MRCSLGLVPVLLWASSSALAQTPPATAASAPDAAAPAQRAEQLKRVEVEGRPSDENIRRASTASKIVITREELEKFGDSTLGELLKRLPGVTTGGRPGRGGEIRMRGMGGGYTQILVNGERMPPGFSLDQLPPEQVERIEVLRAPTAEYGARAVAGTINVVLREALQRKLNEWRAGGQYEHGKLGGGIGWTRNDTFGEGAAYNLTLNALHGERLDTIRNDVDTQTLATGNDVLQSARGQTLEQRDALNFNARLQLPLSKTASLAVQPFLVVNRSRSQTDLTQTTTPLPSPLLPGFFDQADTAARNRFRLARLNTQFQARPDADTRVELRAGLGQARSHAQSLREERLAGLLTRTQDDTTDSHDRSWSLLGKLSHNLGNDHSLVGGLEGEGTTRQQDRLSLVNGLPRTDLADFGDNLDAATQRLAFYAQDEWNSGPLWDYYLGARWEGIRTRSSAANYRVSNHSGVFTPLAHARYKLDERGKELIRVSLTRSYRSPQLQDLIARPSINPAVPHQANTPDRAGNPDLRPELAVGVEIGYEKYLSKGGLMSANLFARQIKDLMRNVTALETVSWSPTPRWVVRPQNIGSARTAGLELEAKFRADEWLDDVPPINLHGNLSLFTSKVEGIPGPNNRLDAQPKGTLNLGADYRLRVLPLTLGGNLNVTPHTDIQQTVLTEALTDRKRVFDAFALWHIDLNTSLRLSASNLAPLDYFTGTRVNTGDQLITTRSGGATYTQWQLRLEMKL